MNNMNSPNFVDRRPKHKDWKEVARQEWSPIYDELIKAVQLKQASAVINSAKKIAEKLVLAKVEATQMRKFLDEIVRIHPKQINIDIPKDQQLEDINDKNKLAILRPRFAYTVTRKENKALKAFYVEVLDRWLEQADSFRQIDLEYLHLFIESLVAYHKVKA